MDVDEARERMQEIQRIMERATLCTLLPGTTAIIGGILVLGGCLASFLMFRWLACADAIRSLDFAEMLHIPLKWQIGFCLMWFLIGLLGVLIEVLITAQTAKRLGLSPTARSAKVALFSLTPSVVVAMVLTVKFLMPVEPKADEIQYIVPIWMMLYGTGIYTAGLFSIRPPRVLGLTFLGMGVAALLALPQYGVLTAALSFGLLHIVFGCYVLWIQRREGVQ